MRYHTPILLFHIEFASLFNFLSFNSKSTEIVIGCSWPNTALLWSTVNHANCKLHAVNRCCCKVPRFPLSPPICQWVMHVVTQPFDLSWTRWYWTQPFEPELSQMLALHNSSCLEPSAYLTQPFDSLLSKMPVLAQPFDSVLSQKLTLMQQFDPVLSQILVWTQPVELALNQMLIWTQPDEPALS